MAVYVVVRPHHMLKGVRYVEDLEDGFVQPVTMEMDEGRYKPYRNYGIAVPLTRELRGHLLRIQKHGIDEVGHRG